MFIPVTRHLDKKSFFIAVSHIVSYEDMTDNKVRIVLTVGVELVVGSAQGITKDIVRVMGINNEG